MWQYTKPTGESALASARTPSLPDLLTSDLDRITRLVHRLSI